MASSLKPKRRSSLSSTTQEPESHGSGNTNSSAKTKKKKRFYYIPRIKIGCFNSTGGDGDGDRSLEMEADNVDSDRPLPTHLVIMVHGIIGSPANWRYAAKQFVKRFPNDVIVHCSECNSAMLTFDGVDIMGQRLAEEVISVIKRRPEVQKISFVCHSLGGLISRYAIGMLYGRNITRESCEENGECVSVESETQSMEDKSKGKIAGLEPMNFITVATPHLGTRGHKQIPILCGFYTLEKMATHNSWIIGRTGKHLMLHDSVEGKPPLLLQMVNDSGDLQFMSALKSFRRRVVYSNTCFDNIVGRRTSSIRRQHELPKRRHLMKNDKYPHIVNVEAPKTASAQEEVLLEANDKTIAMEEAMIRGLTKVSWERVDVSFRGSKQRIFAHSTIQVKTYCINSDGADVIFHMIDNFLL